MKRSSITDEQITHALKLAEPGMPVKNHDPIYPNAEKKEIKTR